MQQLWQKRSEEHLIILIFYHCILIFQHSLHYSPSKEIKINKKENAKTLQDLQNNETIRVWWLNDTVCNNRPWNKELGHLHLYRVHGPFALWPSLEHWKFYFQIFCKTHSLFWLRKLRVHFNQIMSALKKKSALFQLLSLKILYCYHPRHVVYYK